MKRNVFFISDHTGITAEAIGRSLLSQFGTLKFKCHQHPFVDSPEKVHKVVKKINEAADKTKLQPLVFSTLADPALRNGLQQSKASIFDLFAAFSQPLEHLLGTDAAPASGLVHGISDTGNYSERIQAMNFALINDDGAVTRHYEQADLIIVGVSRSGKTPTCLYLGLQYSVLAANYPLTAEDLEKSTLPEALQPFQHKLFGLSIEPQILQVIREQRRPGSQYASLHQCQTEMSQALMMYQTFNIPHIDTSSMSVEEIATRILSTQFGS